MAFGIFAGMGMDAKAEKRYESVKRGVILKYGDYINRTTTGIYKIIYKYEDASGKDVERTVDQSSTDWFKIGWESGKGDISNELGNNETWIVINIESYDANSLQMFLEPYEASTDSCTLNDPLYVSHTHAYSWVTVQDVSSEQDGIEEYRCSCGDVQERCVIPRYMAIVKGLYGAVKNAPQNGTATFDSGRLYTISDYVIKKLAERTDVTTVITFEYQNQAYKMTIPAGSDFTGLLADEEYFYGYFFFANAVGATIEAI